MTETPTPRADDRAHDWDEHCGLTPHKDGDWVPISFARKLERELKLMEGTALEYARSSDEFSAILRTILRAQYENNSTAKEQFGDFEKFYGFTLERHLAVVRKG